MKGYTAGEQLNLEKELNNYIENINPYKKSSVKLFEMGAMAGISVSIPEGTFTINVVKKHKTYTLNSNNQVSLKVLEKKLISVKDWICLLENSIQTYKSFLKTDEPVEILKKLIKEKYDDRNWTVIRKDSRVIIDSNLFKKENVYLSINLEKDELVYVINGKQKNLVEIRQNDWKTYFSGILEKYKELITF